MNKTSILYGISGMIIGITMTLLVIENKTAPDTTITEHDVSHTASSEPMSMDSMMMDMNASLKGKTGEEFDKEFIDEMIIHHQGAIDMANLALTNAEHEEIKTLSQEIITAQTKEIELMKNWQKQWNYSQ